MSVWSIITWTKNSSENGSSVAIQKLTRKHIAGLIIFGVLTTLIFYFILRALNTPNIVFSTISITTSFLASALTLLRSSYYALGYASNDIVLIALMNYRSCVFYRETERGNEIGGSGLYLQFVVQSDFCCS